MWVACAKRDLLLGEIDLIIKLRDPQQDGIYDLEDELKTRFGSFLSNSGSTEDIPPSFFKSTDKFSHASVGQHFRTQGFHNGIGIDLNSARAHVLETCLLLLTNRAPGKIKDLSLYSSLLEYAGNHLLDHLTEVDIQEFKSSQPGRFKDIAHDISILFRSRTALRQWISLVQDKPRFMTQLLGRKYTTTCIQEWIPEYTAADIYSRSAARWLRQAKIKSSKLLGPFARCIAKLWLVYGIIDDYMAIVFLDGYRSISMTLPPRRSLRRVAERMPPGHIRQLASYGQLKRTAKWHQHLGEALYMIGTFEHIQEAVREFRRARRKHGESWPICYGEAQGLCDLQLYHEAIKAASFVLEIGLADRDYREGNLVNIIQFASQQLGDFEAAIKVASKWHGIAPHSEYVALSMISSFHNARRFSDSIDHLKTIWGIEDKPLAIELLWLVIQQNNTASDLISIACAEMGRLDIAEDIFATIIAEGGALGFPQEAVLFDYVLARLYFRHYDEEVKAMVMWESIVRSHPDTIAGVGAAFMLAPLYYTKATEANGDAETWISKLDALVRQWRPSRYVPQSYTFPPSAKIMALLGRWYARRGDIDYARATMRPLINAAAANMAGPNPAVVYSGYSNLAKTLISFGDRENAEIAWAFTKPLEKSKEL
ncbi:hypothetical protein M426DRAFT_22836 [Hypoxylon sp. CI-4A]|nr:hypothetical protein M426DRAFT_22836 [Hypoxylon sp. CI-4A]